MNSEGFIILVNVILQLAFPIAVIIIAMITGKLLEKRHFRSIAKREYLFRDLAVLNGKQIPQEKEILEVRMVTGSVVVSIDYFKRLLASLRKIFGGELKSYNSLMDRGRREATLRMKEAFPDADIIVNFRMQTSSISKGKKNKIGSTEILAYGTALKFMP